jgi:hypothetical protein
LPTGVDAWACAACATTYYTGLVTIGAASFRAGNYQTVTALPPRIAFVVTVTRACRDCGHSFVTPRRTATLCPACLSRVLSRAARNQHSKPSAA